MTQEAKILGIIGSSTLLILIVGVFFLTKNSSFQNGVTPNPISDSNLLIRSDAYKIATDSAKINLIEFGDFQCPACKIAYPNVKQLISEHQGALNFYFRHYPLPQHKNARSSARAAEAAGDQGKFFEMVDKLYLNQDSWAELSSPEEKFIQFAKELNLDIPRFQNDLKSTKYDEKIQRDLSDGNKVGVQGTPTFFFNNTQYTGDYSYQQLKQKIDSLISSPN